jgi:hypothetical protein
MFNSHDRFLRRVVRKLFAGRFQMVSDPFKDPLVYRTYIR